MVRIFAALLGCSAALGTAPTMATEYKQLHAFQPKDDGNFPEAGVIYVDGKLYGTTAIGGDQYDIGTVFSLNLKNGAEKIVHAFDGVDGGLPVANLFRVKGLLYGTAENFGSYKCRVGAGGCGSIFSIDPKTGVESSVYLFAGGKQGGSSVGSLISTGDRLYGTTVGGGSKNCKHGCGTVFSFDPRKGTEKVVYAFQAGSDGYYPEAGLIELGGTLYGTTRFGGGAGCKRDGCGAIFSVDPRSGVEQVVHAFKGGSDGSYPTAGLIAVGSTLYGTTLEGGNSAPGYGTVFSYTPATGAENIVYAFQGGTDGESPAASLLDIDGVLYGTTTAGGTSQSSAGTVFSLNLTTGTKTILYSFLGGSDGAYPLGSLISVNGTLYGTTFYGGVVGVKCANGGESGCGTVFSLTP